MFSCIISRSANSGSTTGGVTQTFTVYGITKNYSDGVKNSAGTLIQRGDQKAIIDAVTVVPVPGDTLTIRGEVWSVVAVDCLDPQGVALLYNMQVRQG